MTTLIQSQTPSTLTNSATRKHHKFGPSRLEYLDTCAAFENRVSSDTSYSDEGTMLHDLMDDVIKQVAVGAFKTTLEQISEWVTSNHELTDEQINYLRFCCKECDKVLALHPEQVLSEINVVIKNEDGSEFNHGYLDVLFIRGGNTGILFDFKFGYIPVPHASINLQGMNYMVGVFQMFPDIQRIGVKFVQPKLGSVSEAIFERANVYEYYERLQIVVARSLAVSKYPETAQQFMKPGPYCDYCENSKHCAVLANHRASFANQFGSLPMPVPIASLTLEKPQDWALARYWVDVIDKGLEGFKAQCQQVAENNGGELRCTLPNGEEVVYEMRERNSDRVLGGAQDISEALKESVTFEQILGAAKLSLTALKPIVETSMTELHNSNLQKGEKKLTKKAAWEQATSTLEALGLLSKPDTKIRFLQLKKQQKQEELPPAPAALQIGDANEEAYIQSLQPGEAGMGSNT